MVKSIVKSLYFDRDKNRICPCVLIEDSMGKKTKMKCEDIESQNKLYDDLVKETNNEK